MKRLLIAPLFLAFSLPCLAQEKQIIFSKLPSYERAIGVASIKTGYECRKIYDDFSYSNEEEQRFFKIVGVTAEEMSEPVVNLLHNEFKKYISEDCRSFNKIEVSKAAGRIANTYDIRVYKELMPGEKVPVELFGQAVSIYALHLCGLDNGIYKSSGELRRALKVARKDSGLPASYFGGKVWDAAQEVKQFFSSDCMQLNDPNERSGEIIFKYFEQQ